MIPPRLGVERRKTRITATQPIREKLRHGEWKPDEKS